MAKIPASDRPRVSASERPAGPAPEPEVHYLKRELDDLVRSSFNTIEFLDGGSLDGLWYWDLEKPEHEWISPKFWELFGYDPATKQHRSSEWQDIINQDDLAVVRDNLQKHSADPSTPYDQVVRYRHRDGSTVWVRCRGLAIRDETGKPIRLLGVHTDVTPLKSTERELANRIRDLEALNRRLNALTSLDELLAALTHELNQPLTAVLANAQAAVRFMAQSPPQLDEVREALDDIIADNGRVTSVLKTLHGLISKKTVSLDVVDIQDLVEKVVALNADELKAHQVAVGVDLSAKLPRVRCDRDQIQQVLTNLLQNAIHAVTVQKTTREVVIAARSDEPRCLIVSVSDTGPGVDTAAIEKVFEGFYSTTPGGMGVGLSISRIFVEANGGTIWAENNHDRGATFSFSLPVDD